MQFVLKTATSGLPSPSQCKSITFDSDDDDDMRNLKNPKMAEMKEEDFFQMEAKTSEFEETQIES